VTRVQAAEKKLLDRPDDIAGWVVLVEGTTDDAVRRAYDATLGSATFAAARAEPRGTLSTYQLVFALSREG
jgi:hypothetical protein